MKEKLSEAKWPGLMCAASLLNIFGSMAAIAVGADKTDKGEINPFGRYKLQLVDHQE